jgi:hypothetical protein
MPNQPRTPNWTYRAPADVQMKARAKAKREGTDLTKKINEWLLDYIYEDDDEGV